MMLHGSAHITLEIDIGYARESENYTALANVLRDLGARLRNVPRDIPFVLDAQELEALKRLVEEREGKPDE